MVLSLRAIDYSGLPDDDDNHKNSFHLLLNCSVFLSTRRSCPVSDNCHGGSRRSFGWFFELPYRRRDAYSRRWYGRYEHPGILLESSASFPLSLELAPSYPSAVTGVGLPLLLHIYLTGGYFFFLPPVSAGPLCFPSSLNNLLTRSETFLCPSPRPRPGEPKN